MMFPQFVIYVLIDNYLKFRKDPSITSQEIEKLYKCCVSCGTVYYKKVYNENKLGLFAA